MDQKVEIKWLPESASDTYDSAKSFLDQLVKPKKARRWMKRLKKAGVSEYATKDILQASAIPIATVRAFDWKKQLDQVHQGDPLSPILLLRQNGGGPLIIADGFHRMCALFSIDQEVSVPCKIGRQSMPRRHLAAAAHMKSRQRFSQGWTVMAN